MRLATLLALVLFIGCSTTKLAPDSGFEEVLGAYEADVDSVDVVWVPGSFEIPTVANQLAGSGRYDAVICLGVVIRGETSHDDFVAGGGRVFFIDRLSDAMNGYLRRSCCDGCSACSPLPRRPRPCGDSSR